MKGAAVVEKKEELSIFLQYNDAAKEGVIRWVIFRYNTQFYNAAE